MTLEEARQIVSTAPSCQKIMDPVVYERCLRAANFEEPDRVPLWDYLDSWPLYQQLAGEVLDDPVQATARVFNALEIDFCRSITMPRSPESEGDEHEGDHYGTRTSGRTVWVTKRPINSAQDLRAYVAALPAPPTPEDYLPQVATTVQQRAVFAPQTFYVPGHGVGFHAAYGTMGMDRFSVMLYDEPRALAELVEYLNAGAVAAAKAYAQARLSPFFFIGDDIAYKQKLMFSPRVLKELFFPGLKAMCEVLRAADIKVIFHSDGYVMDIVRDLLDCGIAGLNPIETMAGMDISLLKREYGRELILVGGVDCSQVIPLGSPERIRQEVRTVLRDGGHGGGLFIGSSSEIVPATPLESIHIFYAACKELGRYPLAF